MALKLDFKNIPKGLKIVLAFLPAVVIAAIVIFVVVLPKTKELNKIKAEIAKQEADINKYQALADKIEILKAENEVLKRKLEKLSAYLPEEKEISSILKQISDIAFTSDIDIISWKPEARKIHPSGIVEEVPFSIVLSGAYHNLGDFFSNLSQLPRIVNLSDIKIAGDSGQKTGKTRLNISAKAATFTAVKEGSAPAASTAKGIAPAVKGQVKGKGK